jgi:uncharacterized circularly permuted ATP-grasp superfamily protein/uncharacterized alpha-E superfamily protein
MHDLLETYVAPAGRFDEVHDREGSLRPHWAAFAQATTAVGPPELAAAQRRIAHQLRDAGVTYNVHADERARAWTLDVLPHIVPAAEWEPLSKGLRQRARLLEAVAADIYGAQRLLRDGSIAPGVVFGHHGFIRAAHAVEPPGGVRLHLVAFDLGRGADGVWRVLGTRAQAPSGAGYALENRLTISRLLPEPFRDLRVRRLAPFFRALQESLLSGAPSDGSTPHVALLTPGRYNETYFEHAYLSRYLGYTLVEGADLTVRDDCVYLKTVGGLRRVHVLMRRVDDSFCDPLELRADSALGVPGLVQAWRAGNIVVANAFGTGVLESPALGPFLPVACEKLLGEPLAVPSPASWWGAESVRLAARDRLARLVIKSASDGGASDVVFGGHLEGEHRERWLDRLVHRPEQYVLEDYVPLAHVPVWTNAGLESRALMMRVFLAADGNGDFHVLPGALSRIGGSDHEVVSGQGGGGSKDTWILSDAPVERFSLLPGRLRAADIARSERAVSSRSVEHLFWLGRYAERSENAARLLRAVLSRLPQGDDSVSASSAPVAEACRRLELLPADLETEKAGHHEYERALIEGITTADGIHGLAYNVGQALRVASTVRDRLSSDNWRILNQLAARLRARSSPVLTLADALELLDHSIFSLVAVGGLEMAHMTRDEGWRFMSLGRHLERVLYVVSTTAVVARSDRIEDPALLDWLLDLSDSIITYRARYMGHAEWIAVADLLLFDRRNPRSAAFQLTKLAKHVPLLPGGDLENPGAELSELASRSANPAEPSAIDNYLKDAEHAALNLSERLTLRYFSHVYEPTHATLL